jgi:hypothetical protein
VKKPLKTVLLAIVSILFYFILSTNKGAVELKNETASASHTEYPEKQKVKSIISKDCIVVSTRTNVAFSFSKNNPNTTFKTFHNSLFVHPKTIERVFNIAYTQYNFYAINVLARFKQTDIIFPFHYFW